MPVDAPVPKDRPLMKAWEAYKDSDEAKNSEKWARHFVCNASPDQGVIDIAHPHLNGSLWAAFCAGYAAAGGNVTV